MVTETKVGVLFDFIYRKGGRLTLSIKNCFQFNQKLIENYPSSTEKIEISTN